MQYTLKAKRKIHPRRYGQARAQMRCWLGLRVRPRMLRHPGSTRRALLAVAAAVPRCTPRNSSCALMPMTRHRQNNQSFSIKRTDASRPTLTPCFARTRLEAVKASQQLCRYRYRARPAVVHSEASITPCSHRRRRRGDCSPGWRSCGAAGSPDRRTTGTTLPAPADALRSLSLHASSQARSLSIIDVPGPLCRGHQTRCEKESQARSKHRFQPRHDLCASGAQ